MRERERAIRLGKAMLHQAIGTNPTTINKTISSLNFLFSLLTIELYITKK